MSRYFDYYSDSDSDSGGFDYPPRSGRGYDPPPRARAHSPPRRDHGASSRRRSSTPWYDRDYSPPTTRPTRPRSPPPTTRGTRPDRYGTSTRAQSPPPGFYFYSPPDSSPPASHRGGRARSPFPIPRGRRHRSPSYSPPPTSRRGGRARSPSPCGPAGPPRGYTGPPRGHNEHPRSPPGLPPRRGPRSHVNSNDDLGINLDDLSLDDVELVAVGPRIHTARATVGVSTVPADTTCPICQDAKKQGEDMRKPNNCDHLFHLECLDEWVNGVADNCNLCPVCRSEITSQVRQRARA